MNGRAWTRDEIMALVETIQIGASISELADRLDRTPEALAAKAARLGLKIPAAAG